MNICGCKPKCDCAFIAVIASVIAGIITAFLNFSATIAVPQYVLWIFFGVALGFLAISILASALRNCCETNICLCTSLTTLSVGVAGTVIASLILLLADIATAGIIGSLITGLLFASFALTITSAICIAKNFASCNK